MDRLQIKIPAKVNLGLDVVRKREDNYHDIKTLMHSINIYDCMSFEKTERIVITCNNPEVPTDERNIVYRCIEKMMSLYGCTPVSVHIEKTIPVAAGLGGGSANGAAALIAMNQMFELGLTDEELCDVGAGIGADIPFMIMAGASVCEGIGDIMRPVFPYLSCYVVLVKPSFGVSTGFAYNRIDTAADLERPDFAELMHGLLNMDREQLSKNLINVFEPFVFEKYPEIAKIKEKFMKLGCIATQMSGSGPSVFALYDNLGDAQKAFTEMSAEYPHVFLTNFVENEDNEAVTVKELR